MTDPQISSRRRGPAGPVVTPALRWWLRVILVLFGVLALDSVYLAAVDIAAWWSGEPREDQAYLWAILIHLVLGLAIILPYIGYGARHAWRGRFRPNRRAVAVGWGLLWVGVALLVTGVLLVRVEIGGVRLGIDQPGLRNTLFWIHAVSPLIAIWLFVLHRLVGPKLRWKRSLVWTAGGLATAVVALSATGTPEPTMPESSQLVALSTSTSDLFSPAMVETAHGDTVPLDHLLDNDHCIECHQDAHAQWADSVHAESSFNNPLYAFAVRNTRQAMIDRHGDLEQSRFCAGCHDPAILMSGSWGEDRWTDPSKADETATDRLGSASIGCIVCHGIESVSDMGNASYTFKDPPRYPFAFSDSPFLQWVNRQLILAKPDFHKRTFLKPVHSQAEFCATCHKVFLPESFNGYKWLPGQNHYDTWRLSGVSGRGIGSWYWPPKISDDCNDCHMPLVPSETVAAKPRDDSGLPTVHHHGFHAANPALAVIAAERNPEDATLGVRADRITDACSRYEQDVLRIDLIGVRAEGRVDGEFRGPVGMAPTWVEPGETVLLESVVRTLKLGHPLTQGTADSNELWIEIEVGMRPDAAAEAARIGGSGDVLAEGKVDPWSKFLNLWMLDRDGNRIERRNPEDIFVPLYNHQIPPGAADLTHYRLVVPEDASGELVIRGRVRYRKFDLTIMQHAFGASEGERLTKALPILDLAETTVTIPIGREAGEATTTLKAPDWQRWNDYGIGLVRAGSGGGVAKGQLAQAIEVFAEVEKLGLADGSLNQGRAMLIEGRVDDAAAALARAAENPELKWPWALDWYAAAAAREQGDLQESVRRLERIIEARYPTAVERGYDFSRDERVWNELATVRFQLARAAATDEAHAEQVGKASEAIERSLALNPQMAQSWFLASRIREATGNAEGAAAALAEFELLRPDDNARDRAIRLARSRSEIADHASEPLAIYDLMPSGPDADAAAVEAAGDATNDAEDRSVAAVTAEGTR